MTDWLKTESETNWLCEYGVVSCNTRKVVTADMSTSNNIITNHQHDYCHYFNELCPPCQKTISISINIPLNFDKVFTKALLIKKEYE